MSDFWDFLMEDHRKNMARMPVKVSKWGKFLAWFGFMYCPLCGSKLVFSHKHGFYDDEVYKCPNKCQFITERFDL